MSKREITVGNYGQVMFDQMMKKKEDCPIPWQVIYDKARPLVEELLALNEETKAASEEGGYFVYDIIGLPVKDGNPKRPKREIIEETQERLFGIPAKDLKEGERCWKINDYNGPCEDQPAFDDAYGNAEMDHIHGKTVYLRSSSWGETVIIETDPDEIVIRVPDDAEERADEYYSEEFWLKKAEELGIKDEE